MAKWGHMQQSACCSAFISILYLIILLHLSMPWLVNKCQILNSHFSFCSLDRGSHMALASYLYSGCCLFHLPCRTPSKMARHVICTMYEACTKMAIQISCDFSASHKHWLLQDGPLSKQCNPLQVYGHPTVPHLPTHYYSKVSRKIVVFLYWVYFFASLVFKHCKMTLIWDEDIAWSSYL